ncbi:MAG TPA: type II CAAX endopeptidase family protein [Verrucomicrobiae bacterium]|nr:type II CAAX endopeptidase family protein [Verrucomicrobiae bacterium]
MSSAKSWRAEAVFFFLAAQALCFFLGSAIIALLHKTHVNGFKDLDGFGPILVATLSFQGATWPLMGLFFWMQNIRWRDGLGLTKKSLALAPLLAVGALILLLPVTWVLQSASVRLMEKFHWKPQIEEAVSLFTGAVSRPEQIYLGIFAVILAPVAEEFIFRGVLFTFVRQLGLRKTAWFGVSLLFALIHGDAAIFIPLFGLALVLTWLYEITDSLLAPIFTHALFNAANLILLAYAPN